MFACVTQTTEGAAGVTCLSAGHPLWLRYVSVAHSVEGRARSTGCARGGAELAAADNVSTTHRPTATVRCPPGENGDHGRRRTKQPRWRRSAWQEIVDQSSGKLPFQYLHSAFPAGVVGGEMTALLATDVGGRVSDSSTLRRAVLLALNLKVSKEILWFQINHRRPLHL